MDGSSPPPHLCPYSSALNTTTDTMALQSYPTIPSELTPEQVFDSVTGIFHALSSDAPTITFQYWTTTRSIIPTFTQDRQEMSYNVLYFTPFSTKLVWTRLYPDQIITNTISARLTETATLQSHSIYYSMSTSSTPATPPIHNYP